MALASAAVGLVSSRRSVQPCCQMLFGNAINGLSAKVFSTSFANPVSCLLPQCFLGFVSGLCHFGDVCMFHCVVFVIVICHTVPFSESDRIFLQTSLQQKMGAIRLSFVSSGSLACHFVGRDPFLLGNHRQTQRGILLQKSFPTCSVLGVL